MTDIKFLTVITLLLSWPANSSFWLQVCLCGIHSASLPASHWWVCAHERQTPQLPAWAAARRTPQTTQLSWGDKYHRAA